MGDCLIQLANMEAMDNSTIKDLSVPFPETEYLIKAEVRFDFTLAKHLI
jgi:hypothetical protein